MFTRTIIFAQAQQRALREAFLCFTTKSARRGNSAELPSLRYTNANA